MDSKKSFLLLGYEHSTKRCHPNNGYGWDLTNFFTRNIVAGQDIQICFDPITKTISITPGDYELSCREMDAIQLFRMENGWMCDYLEQECDDE